MQRKNYRFFFILLSFLASTILFSGSGHIVAEEQKPAAGSPAPVASNSASMAGTEIRLLPANFDVWACDWAPNGKAIIFSGKMQGESAAKMRIWYWPQDPVGNPVPLTNTENLVDFSPRWAPNGSTIVINRRSYGKNGQNPIISALWLKDYPGGAGRQITTGPEDRDPFWSPDGNKIVFSRGEGPYQSRLALIDLTGGNGLEKNIRVIAGNTGEMLISPWWGGNDLIYFTKFTPSAKNVLVAGQTYQVTDFGNGSIWSYNLSDQTTTPVIMDEFDNRLPALSPDGNRLAFISSRITSKEGNGKFDRGSLYIKDLKTGTVTFITNKVSLNGGSLSFSPDGKKLAFFTFRSIRPSIWVIEPN